MTTKELIQKMELIGLAVNHKPIRFSKFKQYADAHQYGSKSNKVYIVYCGIPRENLFAFYPPQTTKQESMEIVYQYYLSVFENEDINEFTYGNIAWGECGIPITKRKL